ncbi:hypothetical protein LSH36_502g01000 [Paralvinella palmiformis]|uniref:Monocarboxylate transporter n=1 Tax=Paralvinella palmiformis TaxID=53620 RepID=A0AAD9J8T2_9ANNE|nr:hypothetical protein LSH36_502g01000 [Paralvinella palmiformis]
MVPIHVLMGMEIGSFGFYYVEYVDYFEAPSSLVGLISTVKAAVHYVLRSNVNNIPPTVFNTNLTLSYVVGLVNSSILKRTAARTTAIYSGVMYVLGFLLTSYAPNIYVLFITNGVLPGMAGSMCLMTMNFLAQKHFTTNRAFGIGCLSVSLSVGLTIAPVLLTFLIQTYGWRGSIFILAALYAHITVLGWLCMEPPALCKAESVKSDPVVVTNKAQHNDCGSQQRRAKLGQRNPKNQTEREDEHYAMSLTSPIRVNDVEVKWKSNNRKQSMRKTEIIATGGISRDTDTRIDDTFGRHISVTVSSSSAPGQENIVDGGCSGRGNPIKSFLIDVFDVSLLKNGNFVMACLCIMLARYNMTLFIQHMPLKATTLALSTDEVSFVMSLFSVVQTVAKICCMVCVNLKWINEMTLCGCGILISGVANCLTLLHSITGLSVAAALEGIGTGYIYDVTHNYDIPFILGGILGLVGVYGIGKSR